MMRIFHVALLSSVLMVHRPNTTPTLTCTTPDKVQISCGEFIIKPFLVGSKLPIYSLVLQPFKEDPTQPLYDSVFRNFDHGPVELRSMLSGKQVRRT